MIPLTPKVNLNEAKYTTLLKDISLSYNSAIQLLFNSFTNNSSLYDMFISMYRFNEICDKDEAIFYTCVSDVFNEFKEYYKELYNNYVKQYDYATGNTRVVERHDTGHSESNDHTYGSSESTGRNYDLPNKVVNPNEEDGYLTSKDKRDGSNQVNNITDHDNTYGSTVTTKYNNEFLDLKRKYLNQIRNLYHEFCEKFKDCFIHVY